MFFDQCFPILATGPSSQSPLWRQIQRLRALTAVASLVVVAMMAPSRPAAADEPLEPKPSAEAETGSNEKIKLFVASGKRLREVTAVLEARGELLLRGEKKKVERIAMEVKGELEYSEKLISDDGQHAIRYYNKAEAQIRIGKGGVKPRLRDERRLIVAKNSDRLRYRAPQGPIRRTELDLLRAQGDSLALAELLPTEAVAIGDTWTPTAGSWAKVMALDSVTQTDVEFTLSERESALAVIEFSGVLDGAVGGVATEIRLRGKMNVDSELNEITWFAISTKEKRAISAAEPGVEATGRLRVAIRPRAKNAKLADSAIAGLPTDVGPATRILELESEKIGFTLVHDPRWRLMIERPDVAILRMVEDGDVLAQCSISRLTARPVDKPFGLVEFQRDIQLALDKHFGQFIETQQYETESGQKVIRVTASGIVSEVPIHWIYFHLTDNHGERLSLAFTLDAKLVERFGGADRTLVNSLEIRPAPAPRAASASGSGSAASP